MPVRIAGRLTLKIDCCPYVQTPSPGGRWRSPGSGARKQVPDIDTIKENNWKKLPASGVSMHGQGVTPSSVP